jgi:hypothetical protein
MGKRFPAAAIDIVRLTWVGMFRSAIWLIRGDLLELPVSLFTHRDECAMPPSLARRHFDADPTKVRDPLGANLWHRRVAALFCEVSQTSTVTDPSR